MTSHIICDIIMDLLKYGKYTEKLKLTAQAVHMQIMMVYMCKQNDRRALLCNLKSFALLLWNTVCAANFDPIQEIGPKVGGCRYFFARLQLTK